MAWAGGKVAVLGFGDCSDPATAAATRALRAHVPGALSEEATAAPAGGLPGLSIEEIRRGLEAGKTAFLNLSPEAEPTLRDLLPQIDRLPLGAERWELFWETRAWLARVLQHANQKPKATELYLQILRVNEEFQLNRVEFPPSSRDLLDLTRSMLPSLPRARLLVTVRGGKGQVHLNGFAVGQTPFVKPLITGEYDVVVADGPRRGFVRHVKLTADTAVEIDLDREAPFVANGGPCYRTGSARDERLKAASAVAGALGADRLVTVRLERLGSEDYVTAALVEVARGRETREGRVRRDGGRFPNLARLAQFVLTGEGSPEPAPGAAPEPAPSADAKPSAPAEAVAARQPEPTSAAAQASEPTKWQRPVAYVLWGLALAAGGVAVYEHVAAGDLEKQMSGLLNADGSLKSGADASRYLDLKSSLDTAKTARLGLAIGAGAAAAVGVGFFVWSVVPGQSQGAPQATLTVAGTF